MRIVFISGAYSGTPEEIAERTELARRAAKKYWENGDVVICPHLNSSGMDDADVEYGHWLNGYIQLIKTCTVVVMLPNWLESNGAKEEYAQAKLYGKVIIFLNKDLCEVESFTDEAAAFNDFIEDTIKHKKNVAGLIDYFYSKLYKIAMEHDNSKLHNPELTDYPKYIFQLRKTEYGSPEYKAITNGGMKESIEHHYANNPHHPQHYENSIEGMTLFDLIEMYCDWKAASVRNPNGSMEKSVEFNVEKFNICPQLASILRNTIGDINEGFIRNCTE